MGNYYVACYQNRLKDNAGEFIEVKHFDDYEQAGSFAYGFTKDTTRIADIINKQENVIYKVLDGNVIFQIDADQYKEYVEQVISASKE